MNIWISDVLPSASHCIVFPILPQFHRNKLIRIINSQTALPLIIYLYTFMQACRPFQECSHAHIKSTLAAPVWYTFVHSSVTYHLPVGFWTSLLLKLCDLAANTAAKNGTQEAECVSISEKEEKGSNRCNACTAGCPVYSMFSHEGECRSMFSFFKKMVSTIKQDA